MNEYTIRFDVEWWATQDTELVRKIIKKEMDSLSRRIEKDVMDIRYPERVKTDA